MKKSFTFLAALLCSIIMLAEEDSIRYNMVVYKTDGSEVSFDVNEISKVIWVLDTINNDVPEHELIQNYIYGRIYNGGSTRTVITNDYKILWSHGDSIQVLNEKGAFESYYLTNGEGTDLGEFSNFKYGGFAEYQDALTAFYGLQKYEKDPYALYWEPSQVYMKGNYGIMPLYAMDTNYNPELTFKPLGGMITLKLKGTDRITEICMDTEGLNETFGGMVNIKGGMPVFVDYSNKHYSLKFENDEGPLLTDEPQEFRIFVPAGDYTNLTFTIYGDSDKHPEPVVKKAKSTIPISAGYMVSISLNVEFSSNEETTK